MILARDFLDVFSQRIKVTGSVDEQVVMVNFYEDILRDRVYAIGGDAFVAYDALLEEGLLINAYAIADLQQMPAIRGQHRRPTKVRCIYGRTAGRMSSSDWDYMSETTQACLQTEAHAHRLDPESLMLPFPARAAILLGGRGQQLSGIYLFSRKLTNLQGFALLNRGLNGQRDGNSAEYAFPDETTH